MKLFWFQRFNNFNFKQLSKEMEESGFFGILFPYSAFDSDYFISIAKDIEVENKIKYMIAIRPYTISAQYLLRLIRGINKISNNRILINFVSGWVYDNEKKMGGIHSSVDDLSSNIEKSNYMCDYLNIVNNMNTDEFNFYVSVTNSIVFEKTKTHNVIVPYSWYKQKKFNLYYEKTIISLCPIIRKTEKEIIDLRDSYSLQDVEFFTEDEFILFLNEINQKNIQGLLIFEDLQNVEKENILKIIKKYKNNIKEKI